ncbi:D-2-hydroxyacid dehydrogenase family protein [Pseudoroseomonas wenyumeiae]|uniref:D-2-hydroxyacid dehydrogenase family protein n=1 Tax=Teichococcus wenyumeiae TaxID=2478470 RepID=A0A3A9JLZ2_9PROT|nr:D-2-hydroxyacid dehydrogenase family protein [Pseudoroseomonas wenyumeiae]RKK05793.1 D-2-hydroxyacid dehydrogenase family protein [Pseudoroseomonas wenyumeiae]RMI25144.1 D-2-hydroxyacid dehydrogenase family protein [Pseudoroseomonas wenyumeiae]
MTLPRCVILDDYQDAALRSADWSALEGRVRVEPLREHLSPAELPATIGDAEIVVAMRERTRFDAATLAQLPALKLLITTAMRNASIDMVAAKARGITVCGTPSVPNPTPELTWGLLLALARHIPQEHANLRAGGAQWQTSLGFDLARKTIGIIGLGNIGQVIARYAHAFGMSVIAWSPNLTQERCGAAGARLAPSLDALLAEADVVTLHMVLAPSTRGMIGAREIGLMKSGALLVNTSRGPLVDAAALQAALREGRIGGAALDVFEEEPLPADSPWRSLPNLVTTPHLGYVSADNYRHYFTGVVEDIDGWLRGSPVRVLAAPG